MVRMKRLELPTICFEGRYSIQLSYIRKNKKLPQMRLVILLLIYEYKIHVREVRIELTPIAYKATDLPMVHSRISIILTYVP